MTDLLTAFDAATRGHRPTGMPEGVVVTDDGPVHRVAGAPWGGMVLYRDLGGLEGAGLDALIARQRDYFAGRGEHFEWKTYAHDAPADLPERLLAAGFEAQEPEAVVIGYVEPLVTPVVLPEGVTLREVTERADLEKIGELEAAVWGGDWSGLVSGLEAELPDGKLVIVVAEAEGQVVSAGWVRLTPKPFASLWGGSTLAGWRRKGIYRALVAYRAKLASDGGFEYLQVDASPDSRPILERLGMSVVTTTTPYIWKPAG
ncbi:GNAT family N-acetyltransferase [Longispora albida]|uniref:GNAT family N-acetyltransferase n=1 Tax=Longispora albida TaxID=203523 RepID=UPI00037CB605|nr:N-acetyltransferase [Longispora albida]